MNSATYKYQVSITVAAGILERILSLGTKPALKTIHFQLSAYDFNDVERICRNLTREMNGACSFQYYLIDERILFGN